jgi:hypothetical protein
VNPWLVVPTLGNRDDTLIPLLQGAGMPSVTVWTGELPVRDYDESTSGDVVLDRGPNIHRWWNLGIDRAVECGADVVVVCNDDVKADPGELLALAAYVEVGSDGPMVVWPQDDEHARTRVTPISGWCFALDSRAIRPDETFSWWWGDNDLELRARAMRSGGALGIRGLGIRHLRTDWHYDRPVKHLIDVDREAFRRRYPALMGGWPT